MQQITGERLQDRWCSRFLFLGEFERLVGREIPFYKLGYISLYNFMKSMPDVATIERLVLLHSVPGVRHKTLHIPLHTALRLSLHVHIPNKILFGCVIIRKICPWNVYPLKPHFYMYMEKLGFAGVYLFLPFLIFVPKHKL